MAQLRAACCVGSFQIVKVRIIINFAISSAEVDALSCASEYKNCGEGGKRKSCKEKIECHTSGTWTLRKRLRITKDSVDRWLGGSKTAGLL